MSLETARALWGEDVVLRALAEPHPEPASAELADELAARSGEEASPGDLARWALGLPWPRFCAVVRIVAGVTRRALLEGE